MKVTDFGATVKGDETKLYTLTNKNGMEIAVSDYGATLVQVIVPDKEGKPCDVVLGYDEAAGYEEGDLFFGAIVGRSANRIGGASFELNGVTYQLEKNDNGNNLHSGMDFYNQRMWKVKETADDYITFELDSPDGDQRYPGAVHIEVTYTLTEDNAVKIAYHAVPDADTLINMTNHSYFNMDGHASGDVLDQEVWIDADAFTRADAESIPTGEITPVEGTPMDFRTKKAIGKEIETDYEALNFGKGYDHNWVLNNKGEFAKVAEMSSEESGITMEVYTDLPGMQLYTGNFIVDAKGKGGAHYHKRQAACFETQFFPDAIHKENFAGPVCKKGETYETTTMYKFIEQQISRKGAMDIKIHDTFFENMCCKKSAKEYEKFILRCGISVKSENAIQIMPDRTADITFKISLSVMQTPFKYISDNQHTDISADFIQGNLWRNDAGINRFAKIILYGKDRVRSLGTDRWVQCLVARCVVVGHEFYSEFPAVLCVIQINVDDTDLCLICIFRRIQKIRIDAWLFFNIIR